MRRGAVREHPFDVDTAVEQVADGVFRATVTDRWNRLLGGPNGGYLVAICLQALREAMPLPDPVVLSAFFLRPAEPGGADVHTEVARAGRRTATAEARLVQGGKERVRVVATFGDLARASGQTAVFNDSPELPPPDEAVDPIAGLTLDGVTLAERVEFRLAERPGWVIGEPTGRPSAAAWARLKGGREPDLLTLPLMADAAAPAVFELGAHGSVTLELTVHLREHPAPGWLACRMGTRHLIEGLYEEDFEIWDCRGRLVAQSRQLAMIVEPASS
jgi:acyl-CoA thioesterase